MNRDREPESLEQVLEWVRQSRVEENRVSLGSILKALGHRSFGPMLLVAGLVTLVPVIGDIPGIPTIMAMLVVLIAGQLLLHWDHFWLPDWMLNRSVKRQTLDKSIARLKPVVRFLDRWLRERMPQLVRGSGVYAIALACIIIAAAMPFMELIPFSANGAGAALTAFGLSLIFRDGLLALLAMALTLGTLAVVVFVFV